MNTEELKYQIALTFLQGIGPKKALLLLRKTESLSQVFEEKLPVLHQLTGISKNQLKLMNRKQALEEADRQVDYIVKHGISTHFYPEVNYPRRLRQCADAPLMLYSKGDFNPNPEKTIAVVGTRAATDYGKRLCEELIRSIAGKNIQVISGMAYGIDICAHQQCVANDVQTIGVLGHGLDRLYPSGHKKTAEFMLRNGGLLTEFIPGTRPDRENFPMRNRIVAGMTDATIVIESKKTGGSLITADLANDYNRDVFAIPGNVDQLYSEGCNLLIQKNKAVLTTGGQDFLKQMNWFEPDQRVDGAQRSCFVELTEEEEKIVKLIADNKLGEHIDILAIKSEIPVSRLNVMLFHLEMNGVLRSLPGKKYSLI